MTFTRIISHDSVNSPGLRLRLSHAADGDPDEIYLAQELTLPEQVNNPDARHVSTDEMIFLDARILRWLISSATELLAELEPVLDGIPQGAPTPCEEIVIRSVDDKFDKEIL